MAKETDSVKIARIDQKVADMDKLLADHIRDDKDHFDRMFGYLKGEFGKFDGRLDKIDGKLDILWDTKNKQEGAFAFSKMGGGIIKLTVSALWTVIVAIATLFIADHK